MSAIVILNCIVGLFFSKKGFLNALFCCHRHFRRISKATKTAMIPARQKTHCSQKTLKAIFEWWPNHASHHTFQLKTTQSEWTPFFVWEAKNYNQTNSSCNSCFKKNNLVRKHEQFRKEYANGWIRTFTSVLVGNKMSCISMPSFFT